MRKIIKAPVKNVEKSTRPTKKTFKSKPTAIKVRVKTKEEFGKDFPETAFVLFNWALSRPRPWPMLSFSVVGLPPTLNHQYERMGRRRKLTAEAVAFRYMVRLALGAKGVNWKPSGVILAMVFLQSPHWITKEYRVRQIDSDNRLKPLFDAIEPVIGHNDATNWEIHAYKVPSSRKRTVVYLFDMGDLVEFYKV